MISLPNYKFFGLAIAVLVSSVLLTSSQADGTHDNVLTTKNCDRTVSSHIRNLCEAYYSSDCQGITTEAPAEPLYDCKIPSQLVDPLFNNDTLTMAHTIMAFYTNSVKETDDGTVIDSVLGAIQLLCKRFVQYGYFSCIKEAVPDFFNNIGINSAYVGDCQNSFDEELSSIEKFYEPDCMVTKIRQANETCSALYDNGCFTGSSINVTCMKPWL